MENQSNKKVEEDSRKVLSRDRSMQITVSSDVKTNTKSKDSKKEVKDLRESLMEKRRASVRSSSTEEWEQSKGKGFSHDDRLAVNYSREKDWDYVDDNKNNDGWLTNKLKGSSKSSNSKTHARDNNEERKSLSKEKIVEKGRRKSREGKESPKRSKKGEEKSAKKYSKSQEKKEEKKKIGGKNPKKESYEKIPEKDEVSNIERDRTEASDGVRDKLKPIQRVDRKESVMDESTFVPDYNEAMGSESEEEVSKQEMKRQYSTAESEKVESESEEETSGEEREKKLKKKKNKHKKHKKNKKKHKKKHKKQNNEDESS